ncbi:MAG: head GIN domain-containing protein [Bacteroidota bacterium]
MKTLSFIFVVIFTSAISCRDPFHTGIKGNGHVVNEARSVSSFDEIKSCDDFNVFVTQDSINSIIVEAEENLVPYISTEINGNKLTIKTEKNRNLHNTKPVNIYLHTGSLSHVSLSGSGNINIEGANTGFLELDISGSGNINCQIDAGSIDAHIAGSGDMTLAGTSDESNFKISGSGKIRSYNLEQYNCHSDISGSGNIYVFANDLLDVDISGSGNVYYIGIPSVNTRITGSGSVINNN